MIQSLPCPRCKKVVHVPEHISSVKCSKCGKVWNAKATDEEQDAPKVDMAAKLAGDSDNRASTDRKNKKGKASGKSKGGIGNVIAGVLAGLLVVGAIGYGVYYYLNLPETVVVADAEPEPEVEQDDDDVVWTPPEYREISMAEPDRKRIYMDLRKAAVTSIEKPLLLIGPPRIAMEKTLQDVFDREIRTQAALHDVSEDDIRQIINEGDAKKWDPSPRSNAKRNGKRLYPKSWSVGWKK